jgi:uncharacterized protein YggE
VNRNRLLFGGTVALAVVALLLVGFGLGRLGGDAEDGAPARGITVSGTGKVRAAPDVADVGLGVSVTARSAQAARAAADARTARVLAVLERRGIARADIQTSQVTLAPAYGPRGEKVAGFTATNTVTARIRDLDSAGAIVAAAAAAGANEMSGPTFTVADPQAAYQRALKVAVADARSHAEAIAEASGLTLGEVSSVTESGESVPVPIAASAKSDLGATPIEPGTLEIEAHVSATYDVDE